MPFVILLVLALSACGSSAAPKRAAPPVSTSTTAESTEPGPFAVLQAEVDAFNRGDVEASIKYFAPNAVLITALGGCNPCAGRDLIREHWSSAIAGQSKLTVSDPKIVGDIATVNSTISSPQFPTGITRAIGTTIVSTRDGQITRLDQRYDTSDPQTKALLAIAHTAR
jgi:hypothetical protein